jgi:phage-related protein
MGALVTIYGLIGTAMPGTSGKASLEAEEIRLESFKKKLSELWKKEEKDINIEAAKELEIAITNLQAYISKERWRQFGLAAFLYVILGAFFAALLTESFLQALAIGAGWTAYLGVVGLRKDGEVRGSIKDREIEELERNVKVREQQVAIMEKSLKESHESFDKLTVESKKKTRVLYALKKIQEGEDIYLLEGTKDLGPWYSPGQFNNERLMKWKNQGKIDYTEI